MKEIELKSWFPEAYRVSIESVCRWGDGYGVLLTIWETDEYRARWNMLIQITDGEIIKKYQFDKAIKWRSVYGLGKGKYLLGSYHGESKPAVVSLFQGEELLKTRYFDKGYATEIRSFQPTVDDNILVEGAYCTIEPAGGHDEYYVHGWTHKITEDLVDAEGSTFTQHQLCYEGGQHKDGNGAGDYYAFDRYMIGKYNAAGKLLWQQDTAITGQERSSKLLSLAPYYLMKGGTLSTDGVLAGGKRGYAHHERGTGMYYPTFFRLSAGGTLLNLSKHLEAIPHLQSVLSIMSIKDGDYYVLGETLIVGEGNGLCLLQVELRPQFSIRSLRYININESGLLPTIEETPSFCGAFISVMAVHQNTKEGKFMVFVNTREGSHGYGKVWSFLIDDKV